MSTRYAILWLTLPGRLLGSGHFLFEQPNSYMGAYPEVGACPGHYGILTNLDQSVTEESGHYHVMG